MIVDVIPFAFWIALTVTPNFTEMLQRVSFFCTV
jgi:hypothetical protein